jgi:hypothetical protein
VWIDAQVREIDDGVAVGVPAAEVVGTSLYPTEEDRRLVVERHARRARLLVAEEVLAHVPVRDDLSSRDEGRVAAGVVGVMMRVQYVLHGQRADALHLLQNLGDVLLILVVDENQPLGRDANRHVARFVQQAVITIGRGTAVRRAAIERTSDQIEAVLHLLDCMGAAGLACCADNATATISAAIVPITSAIRTGRSFASMGDLMWRDYMFRS